MKKLYIASTIILSLVFTIMVGMAGNSINDSLKTEVLKDQKGSQQNTASRYLPIDVSNTQCPQIPDARKKATAIYQQNLKLLEALFNQTKALYDEHLKVCIADSKKSMPRNSCDEQWKKVQDANKASVADPGSQKKYQNYQSAKKDWDACYKKNKDLDSPAKWQPKEWDCYSIYEQAMAWLKESHAEDLALLAAQHDSAQKYLDSLAETCNSKSVSTPPKEGNTKKLMYVDVSKTQCTEIPAKRTEVEKVHKNNMEVWDQIVEETKADIIEIGAECVAEAKKDPVAETACKEKFTKMIQEVDEHFAPNIQEENDDYKKNQDFLNNLEKQCKASEASNPQKEAPKKKFVDVDVNGTQCSQIAAKRTEVENGHKNNLEVWDEVAAELKSDVEDIAIECVAAANKNPEAEAACKASYAKMLEGAKAFVKPKIDAENQDYKKKMSFLDDLEKKCKVGLLLKKDPGPAPQPTPAPAPAPAPTPQPQPQPSPVPSPAPVPAPSPAPAPAANQILYMSRQQDMIYKGACTGYISLVRETEDGDLVTKGDLVVKLSLDNPSIGQLYAGTDCNGSEISSLKIDAGSGSALFSFKGSDIGQTFINAAADGLKSFKILEKVVADPNDY